MWQLSISQNVFHHVHYHDITILQNYCNLLQQDLWWINRIKYKKLAVVLYGILHKTYYIESLSRRNSTEIKHTNLFKLNIFQMASSFSRVQNTTINFVECSNDCLTLHYNRWNGLTDWLVYKNSTLLPEVQETWVL